MQSAGSRVAGIRRIDSAVLLKQIIVWIGLYNTATIASALDTRFNLLYFVEATSRWLPDQS
ncbi:hypothetical protein BDW75DRAFT_219102 [Aspergillus navahoensis]